VRADIERLHAEPADDHAAVVAHVYRLMDRDEKSTGLKSLQGKIWEEGYRSGELKGEVYSDVLPAMERWRDEGIDIAIFSSGSVQAQRSLFGNSTAGDLTRFIRAYFDTTSGPKNAAESYTRIAAALERFPSEVLFVSDVAAELDAARAAGMLTTLCVRLPGFVPPAGPHPIISTFDELHQASGDSQ
jgi:enolase-phosphatase E1